MEGIMRLIFSLLATAAGLYSLLIFIRIVLTWFRGMSHGKPVELLSRVTDPYLDWWRNAINLRLGHLDLSPIAAITVLSIFQMVCSTLARHGRISLGIILSVALSAIWSAASFILGFCLVIIFLRLIAYITNRDIYSPFWKTIDSISQPLIYRINRKIFGSRLVNYLTGIFTAAAVLIVIIIAGGFLVRLLAGFLMKMPL
jgi:YggT family protein